MRQDPLVRRLHEPSVFPDDVLVFTAKGVTLADHVIVPHPFVDFGPARQDAGRERIEALLAIAFRRRLDPDQIQSVAEAAAYARNGDLAGANFRLAASHLCYLPGAHKLALRLDLADQLLSAGLPVTILLKELDLSEPDDLARAYNPDQPRNPAGSGRESGRWTSNATTVDETVTEAKPKRQEAGPINPSAEGTAKIIPVAIGDYPPLPPGYDPSTWTLRYIRPGRWMLTSPGGTKYVSHVEDLGHWRHWDKQGPDDKDGGMWPKDSKKPWTNQRRRPYDDQSDKDPNGDAQPWTPPKNQYIMPIPDIVPAAPVFRVPLFESPALIFGVP